MSLVVVTLAPPPPITEKQAAYSKHCAETKDPNCHQSKSLWIPEDSTGFFTLWIALFTAVLATGTLFLWDATRQAAIAAKNAAETVIPADGNHAVFMRVFYTDVLGREHYSGSVYRMWGEVTPEAQIRIRDEAIVPGSAYWATDESQPQ